MYVKRLRLKNWRNFRDIDVSLQLRTFIVGPNAAGKSNLLDVFRFLRDLAIQQSGGGLQKAMADRGGLSKVRCLAARKDPVVEVEVEVQGDDSDDGTWLYKIGINQEPRGNRQPIIESETVRHNGQLLIERPNDDDKADQQRLTQTHLEQINSNQSFRELARFFERITYLHLVPQLVRHPEAFSGPGLPGDPFGRTFLDRLAVTPKKTRDARLSWIQKSLQKVVPQLKELRFERDEVGMPHLEAPYEHWRPNAGKQREDQFSDGTLRLIALFWSLLDSDSLLLLEEPELSLNAGIVERLAPLISRLQSQKKRRRQVLISSHSPALLSDPGIEPDAILMLMPTKEGTDVRSAGRVKEVRALLDAGLSPAEAILPRFRPKNFGPQLQFTFD